MTSPVQSPVQAVPAISFPDNGGAVVNDEVKIFTVPGNAPARIESVRVVASYPVAHLDEWYALRIYDISGLPLASFVAGAIQLD